MSLDANGAASITPDDVDDGSVVGCTGVPTLSLDQLSFDCNDMGNNTVTLTAANGGDNATCTANVTINDNIVPTANCKNITKYLDANGEVNLSDEAVDDSSYDNCSINTYALSQKYFDCNDVGNHTVTQTLTDASNNTSSCTATVTIADNTPATALCQNKTIYLDAGGAASISVDDIDDGSYDNCGIQSSSLSKLSFDCTNLGDNTVTFSLIDDNGNTSGCTATVTVIDDIAPTVSCGDITIELDANGTITIADDAINTVSTDNCTVTSYSLTQTTFDCSHVGINTVTQTVTDQSGNTTDCTATITVEDNVNPIANCKNIDVYLDAVGDVEVFEEDVDDNSSDACGIATLDLYDNFFTCDNLGPNTYTLEVTDNNNNSSTCSSTITVLDNIKPTIYCYTKQVLINADAFYVLTQDDVYNAASSYDNCTITSVSFPATTYGCSDIGNAYPIVVTVIDQSGNTSTCTASISVGLDTSLPEEWSSNDLGINTLNNTYTFDPCTSLDPSNGAYSISGSGNNATSSTTDNLAFASQSLCGDGSIIAKVESVTGYGYGGLMIRETIDAGAKQASVFSNLSSILRHEVRYSTNGVKQVNSFYKPSPIWLKLERQGDWVFAYCSSNGMSFQYVHGVYLPMQSCVEIGLASFSYMPNTLSETVFSYVSVNSSASGFAQDNELAGIDNPNITNNSNDQKMDVSIFPNPVADHFTIQLAIPLQQPTVVQVMNIHGQIIDQKYLEPMQTHQEWATTDWSPGTYLIRIQQPNEQVLIKKLIVAK